MLYLVFSIIFFLQNQRAHAARSVEFLAESNNTTCTSPVENPSELTRSNCHISLTNVSGSDQVYTISVTATARTLETGTQETATPDPNNPPFTGTLNAGSTIFFIYTYPPLPSSGGTRTPAGGYTQTVTCKGNIGMTNLIANSSGFVIARGTLTNYQQSPPAENRALASVGTIQVGTTNYTQTVIPIGDGKPF